MSEHTPGPWTADYLPQHRMRVTAPGAGTAEPDGAPISICDIALWQVDYEGQMANARLIAAAPQMLEALKACRDDIRAPDHADVEWRARCAQMMDRVNDAIAKAEGK